MSIEQLIKNLKMSTIFTRTTYLALLMGLVFYLHPINSFVFRAGFVASSFYGLIGILILLWGKKAVKYFLILAYTMTALFLVAPGRNYNPSEVKARYLESLVALEGTRYVWGGENSLGIDCSGLLRKAYINAMTQEGILSLNPMLVRKSISQWWHDRTAKMMGKGFRNETSKVTESKSINDLDHNSIMAGDLAVTKDGVHVLAYLGDQKWIQADPVRGTVVVDSIPSDNAWLKTPVKIHRWTDLASQKE